MNDKTSRNWLDTLSEEDKAFIKKFILCSGSLKALAQAYGVSYPTIRLRLDRLIAKIKVLDEHAEMSRFEQTLRALHAEEKLDLPTMQTLLRVYREEQQKETANENQ